MSRERLPDTRESITHRVELTDPISGVHDIYLIVGLYPDGRPGELFVKVGKEGSTIRGLLDTIGIQTSLLLQYGVSLDHICQKLQDVKFAPYGKTDNPKIPECSSITDYIFHWLDKTFGKDREVEHV